MTSKPSNAKSDKAAKVDKNELKCDNIADKQATKNTRSHHAAKESLTTSGKNNGPTVRNKQKMDNTTKVDATNVDKKSNKSLQPIGTRSLESHQCDGNRSQSDKSKKSESSALIKSKVPTSTQKSTIIEVPVTKAKLSIAQAVSIKRQRGFAFDEALRHADDASKVCDNKPSTPVTRRSASESAEKAKSNNEQTLNSIMLDGQTILLPRDLKGTRVFRSYLKLMPFNMETLEPVEPEPKRAKIDKNSMAGKKAVASPEAKKATKVMSNDVTEADEKVKGEKVKDEKKKQEKKKEEKVKEDKVKGGKVEGERVKEEASDMKKGIIDAKKETVDTRTGKVDCTVEKAQNKTEKITKKMDVADIKTMELDAKEDKAYAKKEQIDAKKVQIDVKTKAINAKKEIMEVKKKDAKVPTKFETKSNTKVHVKPNKSSKINQEPILIEDDSIELETPEIVKINKKTAVITEIQPEIVENVDDNVITISDDSSKEGDVSLKTTPTPASNTLSTLPKSILLNRTTPSNTKKRVSFVGVSDSDDEDDRPLRPRSKFKNHIEKHPTVDGLRNKNALEKALNESKCDKSIDVSMVHDETPTQAELGKQQPNDSPELNIEVNTLIDPIATTLESSNIDVLEKQPTKKQRKSRKLKQKGEQISDEPTRIQYSIVCNKNQAAKTSTLVPSSAVESNKSRSKKRKRSKYKATVAVDRPDENTGRKSKKRKHNTLQMLVEEEETNSFVLTNDSSINQTDIMDTIKEVDVDGILKSPILEPQQSLEYMSGVVGVSFESNASADMDPLAMNTSDLQQSFMSLPAVPNEEPEKKVTPLRIRIKKGRVMKNKRRDTSSGERISSNLMNVIEAVAKGECGVPGKRVRKKKSLPEGFVEYASVDDDEELLPFSPNAYQWVPKPRSKRTISHELESQQIENGILVEQRHFENEMRSKFGEHLFKVRVRMDKANETMEPAVAADESTCSTAMMTVPESTFDESLMQFIAPMDQSPAAFETIPESLCDLTTVGANEMSAPNTCNLMINTEEVSSELIPMSDEPSICNDPCGIEAQLLPAPESLPASVQVLLSPHPPNAVPSASSANMVNVGTGTESPTATVDSTTSGYAQGTLTVYALGIPLNGNMNGMTDVPGYSNQIAPTYEDGGQYYLQTDNMANCIEPLEQINQEDIISVLGRTNDTSDLNMDTAINIATFEPAPAVEPQRTVYLVDYNTYVPNISILRTKASVKQIYHQPVQLTTQPQQLNLINDNYCMQPVMSHELSTKLLRHDNPLLNGSTSFDDTILEIQQSSMGESMVTSTETTSTTPRRNGLNILFTTPTKHTSGEDIQFEDLFINESQQQLLNTENFPTTTTSDEPQFNLYSDAFS